MRRALLFSAFALTLNPSAGADGPGTGYRVVTPKGVGITATGINGGGDVVGFEWVEDPKTPGVLGEKPFFARGKEMTYLPVLDGYTATFPAAVSDTGLVVGRVSKPTPPPLRSQAFVWDAKTGIRGIGALGDDYASAACGVSRDGRRVSGFTVGDSQIRACVWDKKGDAWKGTALPHTSGLGSHAVAISGDGRHVAAVHGASACLWVGDDAGGWTRGVIDGPDALVPRAVNDAGAVVGQRHAGDGLTHAFLWSPAGGYRELKEPAGFVRSEASAVNNRGAAVGVVDGPPGSKVGPRAFLYEDGRLRLIDEGGPLFDAATAVNDRGEVAGVLEEKEGD